MIRAKLSNFLQNARAVIFALVVHGLLFSLIGLNLHFTKSAKPIAQQPMQAIVLNQFPEPLPVIAPAPASAKQPEPIIEERPKSKPKPKPKPKPKEKFNYKCGGVVYEVDSKVEAERLQAECDEKAKAKKNLEEKKKLEAEKNKQQELKKKQQDNKKREAEKLKKKKLAEKKREEGLKKEQERKKKAEVEKKKKAEAEKKRKKEQERKKKIAEKKEKAEAARMKAEADQRAREATMLAQIESERIQGEKNAAWSVAVGRIKQAVNNEFNIKLFPTGLRAYYIIQLQPGGQVVNVRLKRSSGNALYDEEGRRAILKASPLPIPTDSRYFENIIEYDHSN